MYSLPSRLVRWFVTNYAIAAAAVYRINFSILFESTFFFLNHHEILLNKFNFSQNKFRQIENILNINKYYNKYKFDPSKTKNCYSVTSETN